MRPLQVALVALVVLAVSIAACTRREAGTTSATPAANVVGPSAVAETAEPARVAVTEPGARNEPSAFPPRDQSFRFRAFDLESKYRDGLRRGPNSSFVDIEGTIVWTQEYLRYRLSACSHTEAIARVTAQILGSPNTTGCGGSAPFPPRNEPLSFRQQLEVIYRDQLRRGTTTTFVDTEGDIVWTQEYLRYRDSGCGQDDAIQKVLRQIDGGGVAPDCTPASTTTTSSTTTTAFTTSTTTAFTSSTTTTTIGPTTTTSTSSTTTSTASTSTTTTSVALSPTANPSFSPNPCTISGSNATLTCTFSGSGSSAGTGTITGYLWSYLSVSVEVAQVNYTPDFGGCGLAGGQQVNVPVTLRVRNSQNVLSAPAPMNVTVRKTNACGFGQ